MEDKRTAVAIPGRIGGPFTPWLTYPCLAAERRGAEIHRVWWRDDADADGDPLDLPPADRAAWVVSQVEAELDKLERPLLVGKSLGTHCSTLAARRALPAVWITPLIAPGQWYGDLVTDGLRRATAPFLLIGGTADPSWDGALARELTPHVLEIDGADHALLVPGPLARSVAVLGEMVTAVERFLDEVIWPG
jgi:hypothetical protein